MSQEPEPNDPKGDPSEQRRHPLQLVTHAAGEGIRMGGSDSPPSSFGAVPTQPPTQPPGTDPTNSSEAVVNRQIHGENGSEPAQSSSVEPNFEPSPRPPAPDQRQQRPLPSWTGFRPEQRRATGGYAVYQAIRDGREIPGLGATGQAAGQPQPERPNNGENNQAREMGTGLPRLNPTGLVPQPHQSPQGGDTRGRPGLVHPAPGFQQPTPPELRPNIPDVPGYFNYNPMTDTTNQGTGGTRSHQLSAAGQQRLDAFNQQALLSVPASPTGQPGQHRLPWGHGPHGGAENTGSLYVRPQPEEDEQTAPWDPDDEETLQSRRTAAYMTGPAPPPAPRPAPTTLPDPSLLPTFLSFRAFLLRPANITPNSPEEETPTCPICQEEFDEGDHRPIEVEQCKHVFGISCINEMFGRRRRNQNMNRCPMCRKDWYASEYRPGRRGRRLPAREPLAEILPPLGWRAEPAQGQNTTPGPAAAAQRLAEEHTPMQHFISQTRAVEVQRIAAAQMIPIAAPDLELTVEENTRVLGEIREYAATVRRRVQGRRGSLPLLAPVHSFEATVHRAITQGYADRDIALAEMDIALRASGLFSEARRRSRQTASASTDAAAGSVGPVGGNEGRQRHQGLTQPWARFERVREAYPEPANLREPPYSQYNPQVEYGPNVLPWQGRGRGQPQPQPVRGNHPTGLRIELPQLPLTQPHYRVVSPITRRETPPSPQRSPPTPLPEDLGWPDWFPADTFSGHAGPVFQDFRNGGEPFPGAMAFVMLSGPDAYDRLREAGARPVSALDALRLQELTRRGGIMWEPVELQPDGALRRGYRIMTRYGDNERTRSYPDVEDEEDLDWGDVRARMVQEQRFFELERQRLVVQRYLQRRYPDPRDRMGVTAETIHNAIDRAGYPSSQQEEGDQPQAQSQDGQAAAASPPDDQQDAMQLDGAQENVSDIDTQLQSIRRELNDLVRAYDAVEAWRRSIRRDINNVVRSYNDMERRRRREQERRPRIDDLFGPRPNRPVEREPFVPSRRFHFDASRERYSPPTPLQRVVVENRRNREEPAQRAERLFDENEPRTRAGLRRLGLKVFKH